MSLNTYTFTGRLGSDAELKFTQGGTPIWTARVAAVTELNNMKEAA